MYYACNMLYKKGREIPVRYLQHRLQTSNNMTIQAESATVCATVCRVERFRAVGASTVYLVYSI